MVVAYITILMCKLNNLYLLKEDDFPIMTEFTIIIEY